MLISLEPTLDGDDTHPAWIANRHTWARELQSCMQLSVRLEQSAAPVLQESESDTEGVIVAALSWRDPSVL